MQAIHSSGKKVLIYLSDGGFCAGLEDCNKRSLIAVVSFKRSCLSTSIVGAVRDPRKAPTVQPRAKESWREEEASGASVQTPTPTMTTSRCTSTRAAVTTSQVDRRSHLHLVSGPPLLPLEDSSSMASTLSPQCSRTWWPPLVSTGLRLWC